MDVLNKQFDNEVVKEEQDNEQVDDQFNEQANIYLDDNEVDDGDERVNIYIDDNVKQNILNNI